MDDITTSKTGWLFNPKLICIHHRNKADATWESAEAERRSLDRTDPPMNFANSRQNRDRYRSRAYDAEEHVAGLERSIRTRDKHIDDLKKELDEWKDGETESHLSTKKRKFSNNLNTHYTHSPSYSPSISTDRSESPIGFVISPAEAAPFMDTTSSLPYNNTMEEYIRQLRDSEQELRKPAWPVFNMLEGMYNRAQATPEAVRTPVQREVISRFYVPLFVSASRSKGMLTELSERARAHQVRQEAARAAAKQRRADAKPPAMDANHEVIAKWLCQSHSAKPRVILGIQHYSDTNTVSLRSIRGRQMILHREPKIERSAMATVRIAYLITAIEVVLTPSYYANFLHDNAIIIAYPIPEVAPYPSDPRNVSLDSVACFFAMQGLAYEDIHDAALYAYLWLRDVKVNNVDVVNLVFQLRYRLYPQLLTHGLPAGINDNTMSEDGVISNRVSSPTPGNQLDGIDIFPNANASVPTASSSQIIPAVSTKDTMDTAETSLSNIESTDTNMDTMLLERYLDSIHPNLLSPYGPQILERYLDLFIRSSYNGISN
ncbi:hypothetical protein FB446DRAFT_792789 [Lentinula raphanica]|nr:hypothetical protein FB446DRAFT_792789 [Lentinula raphanica]